MRPVAQILAAGILFFILPVVQAGEIVLVKGTSSTPDAAERSYAEAMTRTVGRHLAALDIPYRLTDDDGLAAGILDGASVAILPYNPFPVAREKKAIKSFLRGGGKLMVFYSADQALAAMMDLAVGQYKNWDAGGRWSRIRFNSSAPAGVPETVLQESRNIRPVSPVTVAGSVIAGWESSDGTVTGDPAWVRSKNGLWMTHVLLDDGDTMAKRQMLVALLGSLEPAVWPTATRHLLEEATSLGKFTSFDATVSAVENRGRDKPGERQIADWLREASDIHQSIGELSKTGRYAEMLPRIPRLQKALLSAMASTYQGGKGEFRAVWDHAGTGLYPGDWEKTCDLLVDNGIDQILVNILWPYQAHCKHGTLPPSKTLQLHGDQLSACLRAARKRGMKVHVWKICWSVEGAPAETVSRLAGAGKLQRSDTGEVLNWLCPSNPDNQQAEKDSIRDVIKAYPVDGVHLDYIRFRDSHYCYCAGCRERFAAQTGAKVTKWPDDVRRGALKAKYSQWRCDQITRFVRDVKAMCGKVNSGIRVSAAVFGKYPQCVDSVAQDWGSWLRSGDIDFVCPMNYTADAQVFDEWVRNQVGLKAAGKRVFPGIGVTARESRLDALEVMDQIETVRKNGGRGFALFDLNRVLADEVLPYLRLGVTADP